MCLDNNGKLRLVVGLGNPGRSYEHSRHNLGFQVAELLAERANLAGGSLKWSGRFHSLCARHSIAGQPVLLLKPQTFMNRSGEAVQQALDYFHVGLEHMLVVCDDLALAAGRLRLRAGGSAGGHNGLKSVAQRIGGQDYPRLRIGIDAAPPHIDAADYVLMAISPSQRKLYHQTVVSAAEAAEYWVASGIEAAMNKYN